MKFSVKRNKGFSLIELMIALAISSILAIAISEMYAISKNSFYIQNEASKLQESGRFVFNMLISDIRRAGYYGYNPGVDTIFGTSSKVENNNTCPANTNWARMLDRRITGMNDPVSVYECIANDYLTGDVLALRYVDGTHETELDTNRFYLRSSFKSGRLFQGSDSNEPGNIINDGSPESLGQLRAYAYYVGDSGRSCRFKDKNNKSIKIPTLYRESLSADGLPERQEIASGIETVQFKYGVDSNDDQAVNQYFDSNRISNDLNVTPNWNQVIAVRFWILARADCPATNYKNNKTYEMGDLPSYRPKDKFKRQLFTSTVALRN